MRSKFRLRGKNYYLMEPEGEMKVPVKLYLTPELFAELEDDALRQLVEAATLPGVYGAVIGMPDIHKGYGLLYW